MSGTSGTSKFRTTNPSGISTTPTKDLLFDKNYENSRQVSAICCQQFGIQKRCLKYKRYRPRRRSTIDYDNDNRFACAPLTTTLHQQSH
jgi:hypothetical protein